MHDTAYEIGQRFFEVYWQEGFKIILDVGSRNVNGTLRDFCPPDAEYIGVDLEAGQDVDIVLKDPTSFPFPDEYFDLVVSTSCFEHDRMFWLTFGELARVLRSGGYIYINAPSNGLYHSHPYDNWRFYPDAGLALEAWAGKLGFKVTLLESFTATRKREVWNDFVMVFQKHQGNPSPRTNFLFDFYPNSHNARRGSGPEPRNFTRESEDMSLLRRAEEQRASLQAVLSERDETIRELRTSLRKLTKHARSLEAKVQDEARRIKAIYASRSWRATSPFRALAAHLRKSQGN